jgi:hypothetical protein
MAVTTRFRYGLAWRYPTTPSAQREVAGCTIQEINQDTREIGRRVLALIKLKHTCGADLPRWRYPCASCKRNLCRQSRPTGGVGVLDGCSNVYILNSRPVLARAPASARCIARTRPAARFPQKLCSALFLLLCQDLQGIQKPTQPRPADTLVCWEPSPAALDRRGCLRALLQERS